MSSPLGLSVSNYEQSKTFYAAALAPLGLILLVEYPTAVGRCQTAGFGAQLGSPLLASPQFWIHQRSPAPELPAATTAKPEQVVFQVPQRGSVDAFYAAALAAGGRSDAAPGPHRPHDPDYYAARVLDLDGHQLEVVCRGAAG
jgi:catechol 2,3-dioxygenase-like lactoylglutathione lyase family enzyme